METEARPSETGSTALTPQEEAVVNHLLGLNGAKRTDAETLARQMNVSIGEIESTFRSAVQKLDGKVPEDSSFTQTDNSQ